MDFIRIKFSKQLLPENFCFDDSFFYFCQNPESMLTIFSDEAFMKEALKEAKLALAEDEVPIGQ